MSRLKVALVSPYDIAVPGGVSEHVAQLDRALRALGHQTVVIAPASARPGFVPPPNLVTVGRVVCVPANGSIARITLSIGLSSRLKRILREDGFDIVHLHEPFMPLLPFHVLRHSRSVNVATFHAYSTNELGYRRGRFLLMRFFSRVHARIAVSETARSFVARYFPGPYELIPNGVDLERFQDATPIPDLTDGIPNVLFVGRLDDRKGFRYLLRAYADLRRSRVRARLVVVGGYSATQRRYYEACAAASGLGDIVFVGYVSAADLPRYYAAADVVCAPSLGGESFGLVLAEAMAAGKALVASCIPGYREVVSHGVEGLLVPPADAAALGDALRRLLDDPDLRLELGRRGRARATRYAWSLVAQEILECYYNTLMDQGDLKKRGRGESCTERLPPTPLLQIPS